MISVRCRNRADDETSGITGDAGECRADQQAGKRFAPDEFGKQPRAIGADAEKRRVAERYHAGVTENEVEREREQAR